MAVNHSARFSPLHTPPSLRKEADAGPSIFEGFTGVLLVQERSYDYSSPSLPLPPAPVRALSCQKGEHECAARGRCASCASPDARRLATWSRAASLGRAEPGEEGSSDGSARKEAGDSATSGGLRLRRLALEGDGGSVLRTMGRAAESLSPNIFTLESFAPRSPKSTERKSGTLTRRSLKELHQL